MENIEIRSQRFADDVMFFKWIRDLIDLNKLLNNQVIYDIYYVRTYLLILWELITDGRKYAQNMVGERYQIFLNMIEEIKAEYTDDEYFMLQYYRNAASHIFLTKYSVLDKNGNPKHSSNKTCFYNKDGKQIELTQDEVLDIARRVTNNGVGEEMFKRNKIKACNPIINRFSCELLSSVKRR